MIPMEFQNFLKFDEIDTPNLTFAMKQYHEIKSKYKDFILFFKMGDFYETYFEDALTLSGLTGITLTKRVFKALGTVLMAGIPHKSINVYIEKLIKNDRKIVLTEEFDGPDNKKIRKVSKIYTKGTLLDLEFLNSEENNFIASIAKSKDIYAVCHADVSTGELFLCKGNYEEIKSELARINPKELLVIENDKIEEEIYLPYQFELLNYEDSNASPLQKAHFALIKYSKEILKEYMPKFEEAKQYNINKNLIMDYLSRKNLEITKNAYNNKKEGSLLWAIDKCKTPMGKRLLSSYLSCPLTDEEKIKERQNAVIELINNPQAAECLGNLLNNAGDISRLSSRLSNETITPFEFLTVKDSIEIIYKLNEIQKTFNSKLLKITLKDEDKLIELYDLTDKTIQNDSESLKNGKIIKEGSDSGFDLYNGEFTRCKKELKDYEKFLIENTNIKTLKIENKNASFSIKIPDTKTKNIPSDFKIKQKLKNETRYTTDKLIFLEEKYFSLKSKLEEIKALVFENLKKHSKASTPVLREYAKKLALLDVLYSFYKTSKENAFCIPTISKTNKFKVEDGLHIAAKKIYTNYCPLSLDFKNSNFILLTGKNGSGKSTFLKQIASSVILFQSGCLVPAKAAEIPIFNKLCTVLEVKGEIINKKSTHQMQMKELSKILNSINDNTLILLDEIGKNTSYKEGVALDFGIIKFLAGNTKAKTIFTTHYHILCRLTKELNENNTACMVIENENGRRYIEQGETEESGGIVSAKEENLPDEILKTAEILLKKGF